LTGSAGSTGLVGLVGSAGSEGSSKSASKRLLRRLQKVSIAKANSRKLTSDRKESFDLESQRLPFYSTLQDKTKALDLSFRRVLSARPESEYLLIISRFSSGTKTSDKKN